MVAVTASGLAAKAAPDRQAPSVPSGLVATNIVQNGFTVTWTASTDNVGVTGYEVFLSGVSQGTVSTASRTFSSLQPGTPYSVTVRARDAAANWSAQAAPLSVTTTASVPDVIPPSVPAGVNVNGVTGSGFNVSWSASSDDIGVTGYEVFINGLSYGTSVSTSKVVFGLAPLANYSVSVRARDGAANWSAQSVAVNVSTTADTIAPTAPTGLVISFLTSSSFTVSWAASDDDVGVTGYEVFVGGVSQGEGITLAKTVTALQPSTSYSVSVRARDAAGNRSPLSSAVHAVTAADIGLKPALSAASTHVVYLNDQGKGWVWGYNDKGQFGNGTAGSTSSAPVPMAASWGNIRQVAVGDRITIVLRQDGTVWCAGQGFAGQMGNRKMNDAKIPVQVYGLSAVTAIAAANSSGYALKSDGTVWAWGDNYLNALGDGSTTNRSAPVRVGMLTNIVSISAGWHFAMARASDGKVWAWGQNIGGVGSVPLPAQKQGLPPIIKMTACSGNAFALDAQGKAWAWGHNFNGELGNGTTAASAIPAIVSALPAVKDIFGGPGRESPIAVTASNIVYAWGRNDYGQAVPMASARVVVPQQLALGGVVTSTGTQVASFCVQQNGLIRAWGGFPDSVTDPRIASGNMPIGPAPLPLVARADVKQVAVGKSHFLFTDASKRLWALGSNESGQLGGGVGGFRSEALPLSGVGDIIKVAAHDGISGALNSNGQLWLWGRNSSGQLGDASTANNSSPSMVAGLSSVSDFDVGESHTLAVLANGEVWAWGKNTDRQLGIAVAGGIYASPVKVSSLTSIISVAAGSTHSLALSSNGSVWHWGGTTGQAAPAAVSGIQTATKVAAGTGFSLALLQNGTVASWGVNLSGQLGNGGAAYSGGYALVTGLTGVVDIAAGASGAVAVCSDGSLWKWGDSTFSPVRVGASSDAFRVGARVDLRAVIKNDGSIWLWGGEFAKTYTALYDWIHQVAGIRAFASADDSDNDGMEDLWEIAYWGGTTQVPNGDSDGDNIINLQESVHGMNPTSVDSDRDTIPDWLDPYPADFFNAQAPSLTILGGNNQTAPPNSFNPSAFDVAVWRSDGALPFVSAPVTFTVITGGGLVGADRSGAPAPLPVLNSETDEDGTAKAYYMQPSDDGAVSIIRVTAGLSQVDFITSSRILGDDSDSNGLPDPWEQQYFGALGVNPQADADGDGATNLQEYQNGTSPIDYYNGALPQITSLLVGGRPGVDGSISVRVTRLSDGATLANAPVTFSVTTGANEISATPGGSATVLITARTDAQGVARVYLLSPVVGAQTALAETESSGQHVSLTLRLKPAAVTDADANGLPDWWEVKHFGATAVDASADPDTDGASNRQEYERGTLPGVADLSPGDAASLRVFTPLSR